MKAYYMLTEYILHGLYGTEGTVTTVHPVLAVSRHNELARRGERDHVLELVFFHAIPDEVYAATSKSG